MLFLARILICYRVWLLQPLPPVHTNGVPELLTGLLNPKFSLPSSVLEEQRREPLEKATFIAVSDS